MYAQLMHEETETTEHYHCFPKIIESVSKSNKLYNEGKKLPAQTTSEIHIPRVIRATGRYILSLFICNPDLLGMVLFINTQLHIFQLIM